MRIARSLTASRSIRRGGGIYSQGRVCPGGHACPGVKAQGGCAPPPVNRMTDACGNIILPQTSFAGGNNVICYVSYYQMDHVDVQKWLQELFPVLSLNMCIAWWKAKINIFLTGWSEVTVNLQIPKRRLSLIQNPRQRETKNCQEGTHFSECILVKLSIYSQCL